jgi:hypothetical protein
MTIVVVFGIVLLMSGLVPIIIGSNEIAAVNTCQSARYGCSVNSPKYPNTGACDLAYQCSISQFYGADTVTGIRSLAYSLVEIGVVAAVLGAAVVFIGARHSLKVTAKSLNP